MRSVLAATVSAQIQTLIGNHHRGDSRAAARRLGITAEHVTDLLSGDWGRFSLDALAALVSCYGVSIDWLLALPSGGSAQDGAARRDDRHMPPSRRPTAGA